MAIRYCASRLCNAICHLQRLNPGGRGDRRRLVAGINRRDPEIHAGRLGSGREALQGGFIEDSKRPNSADDCASDCPDGFEDAEDFPSVGRNNCSDEMRDQHEDDASNEAKQGPYADSLRLSFPHARILSRQEEGGKASDQQAAATGMSGCD